MVMVQIANEDLSKGKSSLQLAKKKSKDQTRIIVCVCVSACRTQVNAPTFLSSSSRSDFAEMLAEVN